MIHNFLASIFEKKYLIFLSWYGHFTFRIKEKYRQTRYNLLRTKDERRRLKIKNTNKW